MTLVGEYFLLLGKSQIASDLALAQDGTYQFFNGQAPVPEEDSGT